MVLEWLPLVFASGWASGVNAYGVVFLMGLLGRFAGVDVVPELLTRPEVLVVAGVLFLVEAVADKVPLLDSAWDMVHTFVRPAVGAALGLMLSGEASGWSEAFAASVGGFSALASHLVKSSLRLAVNTSPEPVSNIAVSTLEDGAVAGVVALALVAPWVAAGIAGFLLLAGLVATFFAWRLVRRGWRRVRSSRFTSAPA